MISANLVTCALCRSYFADPRQIPCSHAFCFDCISGRFDDETLSLTCPKCEKVHQFRSRVEFHARCMIDGVLASMVTQFKKNQSRLSVVPSLFNTNNNSRPPSSISFISPAPVFAVPSPPRPSVQTPPQETITFQDRIPSQSCSERSTPSVLNQRPSSSSSAARVLIAKCQSCNIRNELIVCEHCDNVICVKCAEQHQSVVNDDVKQKWSLCKTKFEMIHERSLRFDVDQDKAKHAVHSLQTVIDERSDQLIQTLENQKNNYIDMIERHLRTHKQPFTHEEITDEYASIDTRVEKLLRSFDATAENIEDFLFEIEHLEGRLDKLNKLLDSNELKFPVLTLPEPIDLTSLFGSLEFNRSEPNGMDTQLTNGHVHSPIKPTVEDEYVFIDTPMNNNRKIPSMTKIERPPSPSPIPSAPKKKLLWQLEYNSVPYFVRIFGNQLFVCDKYGYMTIFKFNKNNDIRQKPQYVRMSKLFDDNSTSSSLSSLVEDDQTIVDSFVVYKLWIIVFKRKKNELHGTLHLFTHEGKSIQNGKCAHNYPSRELTIDNDFNRLWVLDQKQLGLFFYELPETKSTTNSQNNMNPDEYFKHRHGHVQFSKPFAPIHISINKSTLAVLDKNRQAVHVYDKKTQQELYKHVNIYGNQTHFCWDMALFSDNSLLIKLDDTSTLKTNSSKHIYLQLDSTNQRSVIGQIEETDAYGMMITATDEILIGVRVNTKGIVKCYA